MEWFHTRIIKQADEGLLIMFPDDFPHEILLANWRYEPRTETWFIFKCLYVWSFGLPLRMPEKPSFS